jgi:hypothetical protein
MKVAIEPEGPLRSVAARDRLSASVALGTAIGIFVAICYAIVILAAIALPETRGQELLVN